MHRALRPPSAANVALLGALLLATPAPPPAAAADVEALRRAVLDPAQATAARVKAAASLEKEDVEALGNAILEIGKAKDQKNLPFLVEWTVKDDALHLRALAVHAALQSSPDGVLQAYLDKTGTDDTKGAVRAVHAVGLLVGPLKDRSAYPRLLELTRGSRPILGVEAARALSRCMDKRTAKEVLDATVSVADEHVRKHLVWALQDLTGKGAEKSLEGLKGRPGDEGRRATEALRILADKEEEDFEWNPLAVKGVADWWTKGRTRDRKPSLDKLDKDTQAKVQGFLDYLAKEAPVWHHLFCSTVHQIMFRPGSELRSFDPEKKTLYIPGTELLQCSSDWQGAYVLARYGCIAFDSLHGAPGVGHRGWEPAYVEMHSFYVATKRAPEPLEAFVAKFVAGKPWR